MSWFGGAKNNLHFKINKKRKELQSINLDDDTSSFDEGKRIFTQFEKNNINQRARRGRSSMRSTPMDSITSFPFYDNENDAAYQEVNSSGTELLNKKNSNISTLSYSYSKRNAIADPEGTGHDENQHMNIPKEKRILYLQKNPIKFSAIENKNHRKKSRDESTKRIKEPMHQLKKSRHFPSMKGSTRPVFSPLLMISNEQNLISQPLALTKICDYQDTVDDSKITRPIFSPCI